MSFNMNMYGILYKNFNNDKVKQAKEKLKNNRLQIEDVLTEPELVNSFKISSVCQIQEVLTKKNLMKLIKNIITFPDNDDYNSGFKFPFNSCEILSTENSKILDKFFEDTKKTEKPNYTFDKDDDGEDGIKIDKFYTNSEDKKFSIKKLEIVSPVENKEKEKENKLLSNSAPDLKTINEAFKESKDKLSPLDDKVEKDKDRDKDKDREKFKLEKSESPKIVKEVVKKEVLLGETGSSDGDGNDIEVKDRYSEFAKENNIEIDIEPNQDEELVEANKVEKLEIEIIEANKETIAEVTDNDNKLTDKNADFEPDVKLSKINTNTYEKANKDEEPTIELDDIEFYDPEENSNSKIFNTKTKETDAESFINGKSPITRNANGPSSENYIENINNNKSDYLESTKETINNTINKTEIDIYLEESKYPLLDYLFSFVKAEEDLDHVLCGYFAKVFNTLYMNKTVQLVKFLFERPEIILAMVNHFNRVSIIECLIKLIKYDTDAIILFDRKSCDEVKEEVFKEIFDYIDNKVFNLEEQPEPEVLHCITEFFLECLEDKRTFIFFIKCPKFSLKLFETFLHPTLSKQIYVIARYLEKVYVELTFKPNKQPEVKSKGLSFKSETQTNYSLEKEEDNSLECYYFLELFTSMIDYLFTRFKDESYGMYNYYEKEMENTFGERQKKLGLSKLYIMNLFFQILKHTFFVHENRYFNYEEDFFIEFYEKIMNSDFFSVAVKYFFEFPWNNMYQNIFLDIINEIIVFSHFNRTLVEHVLYEIGFLEEIILCVVDEKYSCISKFQFKSTEIQNGFLTFIIEIAYNVKLYSYNNSILLNIIDKSKLLIF